MTALKTTALKTTALVALCIAGIVTLALSTFTFTGLALVASGLYGILMLQARSVGEDRGRRNAERTIARIHAEVWGTK